MPDHSGRPADPARVVDGGVSRRSFMQTVGVSAATSMLHARAERTLAEEPAAVPVFGPGPQPVTLRVNGKAYPTELDPATTLLEALRVHLNLTGSKEVCDRGSCGGCAVLIDGKLTASCMLLAADAVDADITTVEGLATGDQLAPIQESFIRHDALQCGFCTPGLLMACQAVLNEHPKPTLVQIQHGLSGNICRCGTYTNVFNAVLDASGQAPIQDGKGGAS